MSNIFFCADTHLGHTNILKYQPNRKYATIEEMNADIIRIWNETVGPQDTVWFLGDMCMGPKQFHLDFLNQLNGTVNFVFGNHDYHLAKLAKRGELPPNVIPHPQIVNKKLGGQDFVLCHFPLEDWEGRAEHFGNEPGTGSFCAHGHTHGRLGTVTAPGRIDIGFDNFHRPVEVSEVLSLLS